MSSEVLGIKEIMKTIPHRYPMLLIDRIEELVTLQSAVGVKNLTINEAFFQGHFPENPVMPGVLMVEAMAQTAAVLVVKSIDIDPSLFSVLFTSISDVKFRKQAVPGDVLKIHVNIVKHKLNIWFCEGKIFVDNDLICEAKFSAQMKKEN